MSVEIPAPLLAVIALAAFAAFFTAVSAGLAARSGWTALARAYPDRREKRLASMPMQSAELGDGVRVNGALSLQACPSGLRVSILPILGPTMRPFLAPWDEITTEARTGRFGAQRTRLGFGRPEVGSIIVDTFAWNQVRKAVASPLA